MGNVQRPLYGNRTTSATAIEDSRGRQLLVVKRRPLCRWGILFAVIDYKTIPIPGCRLSGVTLTWIAIASKVIES